MLSWPSLWCVTQWERGRCLPFREVSLGALFVGLSARYLPDKRVLFSALAEPLGTTLLGAATAAVVVAPFLGKSFGYSFFALSFFMSSVIGALLGGCFREISFKKTKGPDE